jgi:hypothetical protein
MTTIGDRIGIVRATKLILTPSSASLRRLGAGGDNPYPVTDKNHALWFEGWRVYDVLREDPPTEAELVDRLARGRLH